MRWWNEAVATIADRTSGGVAGLAFWSFLATLIIALGWYFWPTGLRWRARSNGRRDRDGTPPIGRWRWRWGPMRWRWRWRWRRRRRARADADRGELAPDELPDLPAAVLTLTADQLAAAGRYAEAVRERLRAIVRTLVEAEVIPHSPGWTVTELASAAVRARPDLAGPVRDAVEVFSEIWYGLRPALIDDDHAMRTQAEAVRQLLVRPPTATTTVGGGAA